MASIRSFLVPFDAVVTYSGTNDLPSNEHDRMTRDQLAQDIAEILGLRFDGAHDPRTDRGAFFFVPDDTLVASEARMLGIEDQRQLYGGVVPYGHVGTKAISHGLVGPEAVAPPGWHHRLGLALEDMVLKGFSAFSLDDASAAGKRLLSLGPIRVKPVKASGGQGQVVARSTVELDTMLSSLDGAETVTHGLVIEENLVESVTYSVGMTSLAGEQIAYWGTQRVTRSNSGNSVYGGSDLVLTRGSFEALAALDPGETPGRAIELARRYDQAVSRAHPGLFASRRNYDVIVGSDSQGRRRSGVLEQSWRIGGASGAEIAAFRAFRKDPGLAQLRSATMEIFGESEPPPAHATIYYRGIDPVAGPVTKYAVVKP
jgi:hypothetical protein